MILSLSNEDMSAINWVGYRYCWSNALLDIPVSEGDNSLSPEQVEVLREAFDADAEGGHPYFPCLAPGSELSRKLANLYHGESDDG